MSRAISHYIWFGLNEGYMPALSLDVESSSMSYYLSLVERRVAEFYHNIDRTILIAVATPVPDNKHK